MRYRLPFFLLLSPLTVACYDDTVDPTVSSNTSISISATEAAVVGQAHEFGGLVSTTTSTCTCEYTQNHNALGCRTDAFCESSYDIGADNPQSCSHDDSNPELESLVVTADREDCEVTATKGAPGTFTGTLTCTSEGPVTVTVKVTAKNDVPRATHVAFNVLRADGGI